MSKRLKSRTQKHKIEFSSNLGGPCGENRRTFMDEVVMFTRLRSPLIGVRYWNDLHEDVKNHIAESVMKISSQNSSNRRQLRTNHSMGSKPFSQCSYEKNNTARKLSLTKSDEVGYDEPRSYTSEAAKEDHLFHKTYKETTGCKSNNNHGHGYLSKSNRSQLHQERILQERLEKLKQRERELQKRVEEELAKKEAEKEAEMEQIKASIRQELMQEFQAMMAQNQQHTITRDEVTHEVISCQNLC
uniref:Uncharacterized protein n=1 Tax=Leersia perrieri TaxID=77586 RepID=A0A0D9XZ19_9ORYZ